MEARTPSRPRNEDPNAPRPAWKNPKIWKWAAGIVCVLLLLTIVFRAVRPSKKDGQTASTNTQPTITLTEAELNNRIAQAVAAAQNQPAATTPGQAIQPGQTGAMPRPVQVDQCLYAVLGPTRFGYTIVDSPDGKTQIVTNVLSVDVRPKQ